MYEFFRFNKFFLFVFLILIDQISKYIIRHTGGFYICNKGISFGVQISENIFFFLWLVILSFFLYGLYKKYFIHNTLYIILILSGAVSNLIDRAHYGCVVDFIDLKFFPVFNLADVFISIGATGIVYVLYKKNKADLAL